MINFPCSNIILTRFVPYKNLVCVFNEFYGKIYATGNAKTLDFLWPGTIFSCVLTQKNSKNFMINDAQRVTQVVKFDFEQLIWAQKFMQLCTKIFPLEQQCLETFQMLQQIFQFPWHKATSPLTLMLQKICVIRLLQVSGYIFNRQIDLFNKIFNFFMHSRVDLRALSEIESFVNEFSIIDEKYSLLIAQAQNSLPHNVVDDFFQLLESTQIKYSLKNDKI